MTHQHLDLPDIALIGKMGSGKTLVSDLLSQYGYEQHEFAGPLRSIASQIWGREAQRDREKLQRLGQAIREIEPDTFAAKLTEKIAIARTTRGSRLAVDDCRYPNELWALAEEGFVSVRVVASRNVRVSRLRANGKLTDEAQLDHESETALDSQKIHHVIYNDDNDAERLRRDVVGLLNALAR